MAAGKQDAAALVKQIGSLDRSSFASDEDRLSVIQAIDKLHSRLETPYETVVRWAWIEPQKFNAVKIAVDTRLFHVLAADGGKPKSTAAIAAATTPPIGEELAGRTLRQLAACLVINEVGQSTWAPTELSKDLTRWDYESGIIGLFQTFWGTLALPRLLREKMDPPYTIPTDPANCAWALGNNRPGESLFESFANTPQLGKDFANLMAFFSNNRPRTWDFYPVADRLLPGAKTGGDAPPFMVDLGGSTGHDLKALAAAHPDVLKHGALVDLDREDLITAQGAQLKEAGIKGVAHDFFKPHPDHVKGARAYFLHQIIHDWTDELSRNILTHIRDSMVPGYSKLLIHEYVLPDVGADALASSLDLIMMCNVAAKERTESQFRELVEGVPGLKVEGVHRGQGVAAGEGVIEIVRVS